MKNNIETQPYGPGFYETKAFSEEQALLHHPKPAGGSRTSWMSLPEDFYQDIEKSETALVAEIIQTLESTGFFSHSVIDDIEVQASELLKETRTVELAQQNFFVDWIQEYGLNNQEGLALMRLTECFLRAHKSPLAIDLVDDFIASSDWKSHYQHSPSLWVNLSTFFIDWGAGVLSKIGRTKNPEGADSHPKPHYLQTTIDRLGKPIAISIIKSLLTKLANTFVCGENIDEAVDKCQQQHIEQFSQSFDMLGEESTSLAQAEHYYDRYHQALLTLAAYKNNAFVDPPGLSIKLSALEPRYDPAHWPLVRSRLILRVKTLVALADMHQIPLTIDAEESWRLEMQLDVVNEILAGTKFHTPYLLGIAIQSYQKRASASIRFLEQQCREHQQTMHIRLVKGAYWDTEIKYSQQKGHAQFAVFTHKVHTEVNYLACAHQILSRNNLFYGQFATHNITTLASVIQMASSLDGRQSDHNTCNYEFQKLYGMGDAIHIALKSLTDKKTRSYCPVGHYEELLPYLVRRILENGVNSSFLYHLQKRDLEESLIQHPLRLFSRRRHTSAPTPPLTLPLPPQIYAPTRCGAPTVFLDGFKELNQLMGTWDKGFPKSKRALGSVVGGIDYIATGSTQHLSPCDKSLHLADVSIADSRLAQASIAAAKDALKDIGQTTVTERAALLRSFASELFKRRTELICLLAFEAGKTTADALAEIRESIDFCNYYAAEAEQRLTTPIPLPSVCGESSTLGYEAKGIFACISPWNFPLAIFIGQITAALVTGNAVIAKPASATPMISRYAIDLFISAGLPKHWIQLILTSAKLFDENVLAQGSISGVAFTGSLGSAKAIARTLAAKDGPIISPIAETGGLNFMMVDSSARQEQVIKDSLTSAFNSAGQRCSALRVLLVPDNLLAEYKHQLTQAMSLLVLSAPFTPGCDIGPIISEAALQRIQAYISKNKARIVYQLRSSSPLVKAGNYIGPALLEVFDLDEINEEIFGPVLHIMGYDEAKPEQITNAINQKQFGLTFGIHSRMPSRIRYLSQNIRCGNVYVNRDMIGAVVGSQPFGGQGLSGTGPKAGGPNYLKAFVVEKTVTENTAAFGGNPDLLNQ